ncbi:MAG: hypothetical protein GY737_32090, partial [Desulfobacteraceae bacterium]|nr:hypothetical protein [Desulfobacteraceae bacterium]
MSKGAPTHLPSPPQTMLNPQAQVFENSNQRQPSAFYVTARGEKISFYSQENQERINELKMKYKNIYTADGFQFDNMGPLTWSAEDVVRPGMVLSINDSGANTTCISDVVANGYLNTIACKYGPEAAERFVRW